jgi:hypothetical protein
VEEVLQLLFGVVADRLVRVYEARLAVKPRIPAAQLISWSEIWRAARYLPPCRTPLCVTCATRDPTTRLAYVGGSRPLLQRPQIAVGVTEPGVQNAAHVLDIAHLNPSTHQCRP